MKKFEKWFSSLTEFIAATMLAAMFTTFILQIFSRYILQTPFGWTLELNLTLWVWIVFFGAAFIVKEQDHVTFDIFYLATPAPARKIMAIISAVAIVGIFAWAFLPTIDYIDWMKIRKSATLKIPMRTVLSIYGVFMIVIIIRYAWRLVYVLRNGAPEDHQLIELEDKK